MRRSMLFLPGNRPTMLQNGCVLPADSLIFDLEDAVSMDEKDSARRLVSHALRSLDFGTRERVVRINAEPASCSDADLEVVVTAGCDAVMPPKTVGGSFLRELDRKLTALEATCGLEAGHVNIIPLIETAAGIELAYEAAGASPRVVALALGGEDLAADLGCARTREGSEILYSRQRLVVAARAFGLEVIDTPFTDARDEAGLEADARFAKSLGFTGKLSISPHHLKGIHRAFNPTAEEIERAVGITEAMRRGREEGLGAVSWQGKMIDKPVADQAARVLETARLAGLLPKERNER